MAAKMNLPKRAGPAAVALAIGLRKYWLLGALAAVLMSVALYLLMDVRRPTPGSLPTLTMSPDGRTVSEESERRLRTLTDEGVDVVAWLLAAYGDPHSSQPAVVRRSSIIGALRYVGTDSAAAALRRLASEEACGSLAGEAAQAFFAVAPGSVGAAQRMLRSPHDYVRSVALRSLAGTPLTPRLIRSLRPLSQRDDLGTHMGLLQACRSDPSPRTAAARLDFLLGDGSRLWLNMDRRDPSDGYRNGNLYWPYIAALSEIAAGPALLRSRLKGAAGGRRTMLLTALARTGEADVHDELVGEIRRAASGFVRCEGILALVAGKIATPQDAAWLQQLLVSDPFVGDPGCEQPTTPRYPVRDAARAALRRLGERTEADETE
jgi:hypothetical protein